MKQKPENGLALSGKWATQRRSYWISLFAAGLSSAGAMGILLTAFPGVQTPQWVFLPLCFAACAAILPFLRGKHRGAASLTVCALVAAFWLLFHGAAKTGLAQLSNDLLRWLSTETGRIYLPFACAEEDRRLFLLLPVGVLLTLCACQSAVAGKAGFLIPCWALCAVGCALGLFEPGLGLALLCLGSALLLLRTAGRPSFSAVALLLLCLLLSALPSACSLPKSNLRQSVSDWLHRLRYDSESNSMPEGALENLAPWSPSDTPALSVRMQRPQQLYLRGMVGEVYTGTSWQPLAPQESDLFYWLHQDGFYAQSAVASAASLTLELEPLEMTVCNLSACKQYNYLPCGLSGNTILDSRQIGDSTSRAKSDCVTFSYLPGGVPEWYETQACLSARQDEPEISAYLAREQAYRRYVYDNDLQLTPAATQTLTRLLGDAPEAKTLSEIRGEILAVLDDTLTYDETVSTPNGEQDFLQYVLETSRAGYSVHYATAAVLLLRQYGVPARYAEGYFLSAEEAAKYEPGEEIVLDETHAHAWAEYYLDGVGWLPFEVTPGYPDDETLLGGETGGAAEKHYRNDNLPQAAPVQSEAAQRTQGIFRPEWLLLLLFLFLLPPLLLLLRRRYRLRKALRTMREANNRDAIAMYYGYAVHLARHAPVTIPGAQDAAKLNQEALFSSHEMTAAQRQWMEAFAQETLAQCKRQWGFRKRLRLRWITCLY